MSIHNPYSASSLLRIIVAGIMAFSVFTHQSLFSQQKKETVVHLERADSLIGKTVNGESVRELIGNVKLSQENIHVTCDKATEFLAKKLFLLEGNVRIVEDSLIFTGKRGTYSSDTKIAEGFDGIRVEEGKKVLTSNRGKYFSGERKAFFQGSVVAVDTDATLASNELTYYRNDKHVEAVGNVVLSNKDKSLKSFGMRFENFPDSKFSRLTGNPKVIQIDTASDGTIDTLTITSDTLETLQDSLEHLWAKHNVVIARESVTAFAGTLSYIRAHDSIALMEKPVVLYNEHQVSGDSIFLLLSNRQLDKAFIKHHALAISRSDSLYPKRFNQLSGETMDLLFVEKKISQINVHHSATSLYFLFDDDSTNAKEKKNDTKKPNGVNKATGDEVHISFQNGKVSRITVVGGVEGQFFPENLVEGKEEEFRLDGFHWLEQKSRTDTLKSN